MTAADRRTNDLGPVIRRRLVRETAAKNLVLLTTLAAAYPSVAGFLRDAVPRSGPGTAGSLLVAVSILAVIACFGNFAFSYEYVDLRHAGWRYLAHATSGILMLVIGLSLEICAVLTSLVIGSFPLLEASWALLYVASALDDVLDVHRAWIRGAGGAPKEHG